MPQTKISGSQIADNSVTEATLASNSIIRADLNTSVSGKAVIAKVINNNGLSASYTGADAGTGDVTLSLMMASASQLGGVRIGSGISIDGSGIISVSTSTSAPLNQVVYGTGTGITSSAGFKFDNTTSNLQIGTGTFINIAKLEVRGLVRFGTGTGTGYGNVFSDQRNEHAFVVHQSGTDNVYAAFGVTDGGSWKFRVNKDGGLSSTFTGINTFDGKIKIGTTASVVPLDLEISSTSAGTVGITIMNATANSAEAIYIGQNGNSYASFTRLNSTFSASVLGTSVPGNNLLIVQNNVSGSVSNGPFGFGGSIIYNFGGNTGTNYGTRLDSVGWRLDKLNTLHTANTKLFQVSGMNYNESGTLRTMTIGAAGALTLQVDEASSTTGVIKSANHLLLGGSSLTNHTIYFSNTDTSIVHTATGGHIFNGGVITSNFVGTNTFAGTLSVSGGTSGNWNTAYSKMISSAAVTGSSSKTLTITLADASTVTASWTDLGLTPRVTTVASDLNPAANVDTTDIYIITALAGNITIATPTGTPASEQSLQYKIRTNGTTYTLTMGSAFRDFTLLVPGTVNSKWLRIAAFYNTEDAIWDIHAVDIQP